MTDQEIKDQLAESLAGIASNPRASERDRKWAKGALVQMVAQAEAARAQRDG
jgi:hypothetical protein